MQGLERDAQHLGGARLVALGLLERQEDQAALDLVDRHAREHDRVVPRGAAAHGGGQVLGRDQLAGRDDDRALHRVAQLAHVARPRVAHDQVARRVVEPDHRLALAMREVDGEALGQRELVVAALAQRRQVQVEHVQPVVQVLAQRARALRLLEVAVRRRDHAHVDVDLLAAADAAEIPLLERAQELGLQERRHLPDLVEEDGPAVGQLERAQPGCDRAREGPLLVAEQLGFQQVSGIAAQLIGMKGWAARAERWCRVRRRVPFLSPTPP